MKLSIWVTKNCNMGCRYCYEQGIEQKEEAGPQDGIIDKTLEFVEMMAKKTGEKKLYVKLFGGEPLLKFDFIKKFVEEMNDKLGEKLKIIYSVTTNGLLIHDEVLNWLIDNNVECALSIDGDEATYSTNRVMKNGSSAWAQVDKVVDKLAASNIKKSARVTYNSFTYKNLYSDIVYLVNRGFRTFRVVPDFFDDNWKDSDMEILQEQISKIMEYRKREPEVYISLDDEKLMQEKLGCSGGYSMFSVDNLGDIYPCTYVVGIEQFKIGNVFNMEEIEPKYSDSTQSIREDCVGCRYYKCCKAGGCLYGNYKMTGSMYKCSAIFCRYQTMLYQLKGV